MGDIKEIVTCVLTNDFLDKFNNEIAFEQLCSISEEYNICNADVSIFLPID